MIVLHFDWLFECVPLPAGKPLNLTDTAALVQHCLSEPEPILSHSQPRQLDKQLLFLP